MAPNDVVVNDDVTILLKIKFPKKLLFIYYYYYILLFFMNNFELLDVVVSVESKRFLYKIQLSSAPDSI
jgi:hypothetical protein